MSTLFSHDAPVWFGVSARFLGWKPEDFWRATPAEFAMALRDSTEETGTAGPSRERIAQMMERDTNGR